MRRAATVTLFFMLCLCTAGCEERAYPVVPAVAFQQSLLREAVSFLAELTGRTITLAPDVNAIDDLYVDLPETRGKRLDVILQALIGFIEKEHKRKLTWRTSDSGNIIIESVKEMQ